MMTPTDYISEFVYEKYFWPALQRGEKTVRIDTSDVHDALNGTYSRHFVCSVLTSIHFRHTYHLALESAEIGAEAAYTFRLDSGGAARA